MMKEEVLLTHPWPVTTELPSIYEALLDSCLLFLASCMKLWHFVAFCGNFCRIAPPLALQIRPPVHLSPFMSGFGWLRYVGRTWETSGQANFP